jgi:hypothetical protein
VTHSPPDRQTVGLSLVRNDERLRNFGYHCLYRFAATFPLHATVVKTALCP